jgi:riboflavin kinase/FMN adenylyltransferase
VVRGISLATKLGYPTANINPHHEVLPPAGIYSVSVILGEKRYRGAGYIGNKPTIRRRTQDAGRRNIFVEVHIFGLKKNLYGKDLEIQFIHKIRSDKKFSTLASLALQIRKDILIIKKSFSTP